MVFYGKEFGNGYPITGMQLPFPENLPSSEEIQKLNNVVQGKWISLNTSMQHSFSENIPSLEEVQELNNGVQGRNLEKDTLIT